MLYHVLEKANGADNIYHAVEAALATPNIPEHMVVQVISARPLQNDTTYSFKSTRQFGGLNGEYYIHGILDETK